MRKQEFKLGSSHNTFHRSDGVTDLGFIELVALFATNIIMKLIEASYRI